MSTGSTFNNMKVAVFAAGGVGAYFGGRLAQAGVDVVLFARGEHLKALSQTGLQVESLCGDFKLPVVQATDDANTVGVVDLVIIAVKGWQLGQALAETRPLAGKETVFLPLLNGVEAAPRIAEVYGNERVLAGLCSLISMVVAPGHVRHIGADPVIRIGELDNRRSERVRAIERLFALAQGVQIEVPQNIHVALWNKFILIAPWSGIGAVTRAPIGVTREIPQTRELLLRAMREVFHVALAQGVPLDEAGSIARTLKFIDDLPFEGTASMQRDIMDGRPSELETQTGSVVRLGTKYGVETPVNDVIYRALLPLERRARRELQF